MRELGLAGVRRRWRARPHASAPRASSATDASVDLVAAARHASEHERKGGGAPVCQQREKEEGEEEEEEW